MEVEIEVSSAIYTFADPEVCVWRGRGGGVDPTWKITKCLPKVNGYFIIKFKAAIFKKYT